jgi:hypothetical protein
MWGLFGIVYLEMVAEIGNRWIADGHRVVADMDAMAQKDRLAELQFQKYLDTQKLKSHKKAQPKPLPLVAVVDSASIHPDN